MRNCLWAEGFVTIETYAGKLRGASRGNVEGGKKKDLGKNYRNKKGEKIDK